MNGIENAQHDLTEAALSLSTAIDLLDSIGTEATDRQLTALVHRLREIKLRLDDSRAELNSLHAAGEH